MKVSIDSKRCQGHARCYVYAPDVFDFDDEGYAFVRPGFEDVSPEHEEGVRKACLNCPEDAIRIED